MWMNEADETDFDETDNIFEKINTYGDKGDGEFERHQEYLKNFGRVPKEITEEKEDEVSDAIFGRVAVEEKKERIVYKDVKYDGDYAKFDPTNILYYAYEKEKSWIFKININDNTSTRFEISNLSQKQIPAGHQIIQMPQTNKIYVSGGIG